MVVWETGRGLHTEYACGLPRSNWLRWLPLTFFGSKHSWPGLCMHIPDEPEGMWEQEFQFGCTTCGKRYKYQWILKWHKMHCEGEDVMEQLELDVWKSSHLHECSMCERRFKHTEVMELHGRYMNYFLKKTDHWKRWCLPEYNLLPGRS